MFTVKPDVEAPRVDVNPLGPRRDLTPRNDVAVVLPPADLGFLDFQR